MEKIWILVAVGGLAITMIRLFMATQKSKQQVQANEAQKNLYRQRMEAFVSANSGHADLSLDSSCAALALDKTKGMLFCVSQNVGMDGVSIPLGELEEVRLEDNSEDYRHALEMEAYYSKVHRTSMYRPNGGHKWDEVKQGHMEFEAFKGESIYGVEIKHRDGDIIQVPLYRGDGTLFWTEEENLEKAKKFVCTLEAAIVEAKAS